MKDSVWMQILPMRQDYGYSGVAKPPNSNANIAMYAVGGAAVGAVAGAGAMYAYNNMILGSKWRMWNAIDMRWPFAVEFEMPFSSLQLQAIK